MTPERLVPTESRGSTFSGEGPLDFCTRLRVRNQSAATLRTTPVAFSQITWVGFRKASNQLLGP
jgi:hypothetical protein